MSGTRTVTIAVRCMVTVECDVQMFHDETEIVAVRSVSLPDPADVMDGLDADEYFDQLDQAYAEAE